MLVHLLLKLCSSCVALQNVVEYKNENIIIDETNLLVYINKDPFCFSDIDYVTAQKVDSCGSNNVIFPSKLTFLLQNGRKISCCFSDKHLLFKTLKKLKPYVMIKTDLDYENEFVMSGGLLLIIWICIILLCVVFS